jgi:hypothetical protein
LFFFEGDIIPQKFLKWIVYTSISANSWRIYLATSRATKSKL